MFDDLTLQPAEKVPGAIAFRPFIRGCFQELGRMSEAFINTRKEYNRHPTPAMMNKLLILGALLDCFSMETGDDKRTLPLSLGEELQSWQRSWEQEKNKMDESLTPFMDSARKISDFIQQHIEPYFVKQQSKPLARQQILFFVSAYRLHLEITFTILAFLFIIFTIAVAMVGLPAATIPLGLFAIIFLFLNTGVSVLAGYSFEQKCAEKEKEKDTYLAKILHYLDTIAVAADKLCSDVTGGGNEQPGTNADSVPLPLANSDILIGPSSIHEHLMIINISADLVITGWNAAAERITGYTANEVLNQSILNVVDEKTAEALRTCVKRPNRPIMINSVRLLGKRQAAVNARVSISRASVQGGPTAVVLCGTVLDDFHKTNHSYVVRQLNVQLQYELITLLKLLGHTTDDDGEEILGDTSAGSGVDDPALKANECLEIAQLMMWSNVDRIANRMPHWELTTMDSMLVDLTREFLQRLDLNISKKGLPDVFSIDADCFTGIMMDLLTTSTGRTSVSIGYQIISEECDGFVYVTAETLDEGASFGVVRSKLLDIRRTMAQCGGLAVCLNEGKLFLRFPIRLARNIPRTNSFGSMISATHGSSVMSFGAQIQEFYTFVVYEPITLIRNSLCDMLWSLGQAVILVDSVEGLERRLTSNNLHIDAVILTIDDESGRDMLHFLDKFKDNKSLFLALTSDLKNFPHLNYETLTDVQKLTKPFKKSAISSLIKRTSAKRCEVNEKKAEEEKRRKLFQKHKNAAWKRLKLLGKGSFGSVFLAENTVTGGKMAVKELSMRNIDDERSKEFENEIGIMCELDHPNIIHYFHCERTADTLLLFMEFCDEGQLATLLKEKGRFTLNQTRIYTQQLVDALAYLHSKDFVHRDIKPENILLSHGRLKLTDFGTAAQVKGNTLTQTAGTFRYMAPEVFNGDPYGTACDVWSLGVLVLDMLGIPIPFLDNKDMLALTDFYTSLTPSSRLELPDALHGDLRSFVELCLHPDQSKRSKMATLAYHPMLVEEAPETFVQCAEGIVIRRDRDLFGASTGSNLIGFERPACCDFGASGFANSAMTSEFNVIPGLRKGLPPGVNGLPPGISGLPPGISGLPPGISDPPPGISGLPPGISDPPPSKKEDEKSEKLAVVVFSLSSGSELIPEGAANKAEPKSVAYTLPGEDQ